MSRSLQEKLENLQIFYSMVPKHKGTEKLCMNVKKQIAKLKAQIEEEKKHKKISRASLGWFVEKHGAAQLLLLGLTNSGKSSIISRVTNARPVISPHPYTTTEPVAGMLPFEDISFQLVEAPSFKPSEDEGWNRRVASLARNADGLIFVLNLEEDVCWQYEFIIRMLDNLNVSIEKPKAYVTIEKKPANIGIQIVGRIVDSTYDEVKRLLNSCGIQNAVVKVYGEASINDVEEAVFGEVVYKPVLVVANKVDVEGSKENLENLKMLIKDADKVLSTSCVTGECLDMLGFKIFKTLEIIRVYTKPPGKRERSNKPIIVRKGSTVIDVAREIHSELCEKFSYAKIWGQSAKYDGEKVGLNHILMDGDTVEIRLKK
ncbi:MAG: TGS domain-containing protein [Candidatus Bathyarchaeota archaeon]